MATRTTLLALVVTLAYALPLSAQDPAKPDQPNAKQAGEKQMQGMGQQGMGGMT